MNTRMVQEIDKWPAVWFIWQVSRCTLFSLTRSLKLIRLIGWVNSQIKRAGVLLLLVGPDFDCVVVAAVVVDVDGATDEDEDDDEYC